MPLGAPAVDGAFPASDPSFGLDEEALGTAGAAISPASVSALGCEVVDLEVEGAFFMVVANREVLFS